MSVIDYEHFIKEIKDYAVFMLDKTGRIVTWNEGAERIKGYSEQEIVGKHFSVLYTKRDRTQDLPEILLDEARTYGRTEDTGSRVRKDGSEFFANVVITAIYGDNKEVCGYTKITRDLTYQAELRRHLQHSEQNLRNIIESVQNAMLIISLSGEIRFANKEAVNLSGYTLPELLKAKIQSLINPAFTDDSKNFSKGVTHFLNEIKIPDPVKFNLRTKENRIIPAEAEFSMINDENRGEGYIAVSLRDVSGRKDIERQFKKLNDLLALRTAEIERLREEKDMMLKEIHHRVKNNLQMVSSLLKMQAGKISSSDEAEYILASERRIHSIALIHSHLYRTDDFSRINFSEYVMDLAESLLSGFKIPGKKVLVNCDMRNICFNIGTAIPCGLLLNELIQNSIKHAFPGDMSGTINIRITKKIKSYSLEYIDDGIGAGRNSLTGGPGKLGVTLINTLVEQLEGRSYTDSSHGMHFRLRFEDLQGTGSYAM